MERIIQVKLREMGQVFSFACADDNVRAGDYVIAEADRGIDYGHVISEAEAKAGEKPKDEPVRKIMRIADSNDLKQIDDNKAKAKQDYATCVKKIEEYKLDMKLVDCEYSFDRSKIIFYFTAEGRVDFRDLVKDLAKMFKARIELRQIGVRDEAKLFGGFGICGRTLCCATFLKDFEPVMIKMAKEQGLPLNPPKISGICGRLMCCLSYEYRTYSELSKHLPKEGDCLATECGKGKVVSVNKLKRCCMIEFEDGRQIKKEFK
ncbi:stage 0 sporulation protein [bacterium]|nr:MAG: stage 0 sporulation protein [bacterium]